MLIDEYMDYHLTYQKKYGDKTVVLMEVGSFFEIYGVDNAKEKIVNIKEITEVLNITLSKKNKSCEDNSRKNCLMAGFPNVAISRYLPILLQNNYTVVLVTQTTPPPSPKREVTDIISPGTYIEEIYNKSPKDDNNISSIFLDKVTDFKTGKELFFIGLSTIDLSTGKCSIYEIINNKNYCFENIYQYIEANEPKELIIINKTKYNIENNFHHRKVYLVDYNNDKNKVKYLEEFFKKIYNNTGMLSSLEFLDMERKLYAANSFMYLLTFSYEHNENIIKRIHKPIIWNDDKKLTLYNNCLYQLNITSKDNSHNDLINILDKTSTPMGRRMLRKHIVQPLTKNLNYYYEHIEIFKDNIKLLEEPLKNIIDIERLKRRILLKTIHPHEMYNFYLSIKYCLDLFDSIKDIFKYDLKIIETINDFIKYCDETFNMDELNKYTINDIKKSIFQKGLNIELDTVQEQMENIFKFYEKDIKKLSKKLIKKSKKIIKNEPIRLDFNERDGYHYVITKKRYELIKSSEFTKRPIGSSFKLTSNEITKKSNKLIVYQDKIKIINKDFFLLKLEEIFEKFDTKLNDIIKNIAMIDYIKSNARCAVEYKYSMPIIKDDDESSVLVKGLRHPIIERLDSGIEYVPNDLSFDSKKGLLLFGLNGVGKSSLMKAIGLSVIMAQAGMYVPCDYMELTPFLKIFTRISGDDNIFRGQSSFTVEMEELRAILKYADKNSLVLGDEICRGTETISALSIVTASVLDLSKKNVKFIFATHLHKLNELVIDDNIKFSHLHVENKIIDGEEKLIYHRKLKDGIGSSLYGLEVAKYLLDSPDFIKDAHLIRNKIIDKREIQTTKTSSYNSGLYIDCCKICGSTDMLDTHHIKFQEDADKDGFIGHVHKNDLSNLIILCKKCHQALHNGLFSIDGYEKTASGLEIKKDTKKIKKKKKYSDENIKIINSLKECNMKYVIETLKNEYKMKISPTTVRKIWNGKY